MGTPAPCRINGLLLHRIHPDIENHRKPPFAIAIEKLSKESDPNRQWSCRTTIIAISQQVSTCPSIVGSTFGEDIEQLGESLIGKVNSL
jgi:hypothetical protein